MSERIYYVICADNCKFEGMTKEQILTAIEQAISTGEIHDVDTGFVTKIKEQNRNTALSFWVGTNAEYNAIAEKKQNCFYIITDDPTGEDLKAALEEMQKAIEAHNDRIPPLAQIVVTAGGGVVTCINDEGEEIPQASAINNVWTFNIKAYGEYTITGVYGNLTQTKTVNVTAVQQYAETLDYYASTFADNDWATIIDVCKNGIAPDTWAVGDEKTVTIQNNSYKVRIIGKAHDEDVYGNVAPITFMFASTPETLADVDMNGSNTNVGGWTGCEIYNENFPSFLSLFPAEIKTAIRKVKKFTSAGGGDNTINVSYDELFLVSEVERFGAVKYSVAGEGTQYEYFKNGNGFVSSGTTSRTHLLRSPAAGKSDTFCTCKGANSKYEEASTSYANTNGYATPAFCF